MLVISVEDIPFSLDDEATFNDQCMMNGHFDYNVLMVVHLWFSAIQVWSCLACLHG